MKICSLPDIMKKDFDKDSLVYINDNEFCYNEDFPKSVINDIENHTLQIYEGYYHFNKGWDSPKIYLIGRGKKSGKFKIKIEGFYPYCYIKKDGGEYKSYLGTPVEKIIFKGMHPSRVKTYRDTRRKMGWPLPYEADILFVRRFLIDTYDYFKPKEPITPKVAILDIETDHPVSNEIIAYSINNQETDIIYGSKYDIKYESELVLDLFRELIKYDVVTGWNIEFDIYGDKNITTLNSIIKDEMGILDKINQFLEYARQGRNLNKEEYIKGMGDRYFPYDESKNLIDLLIKYNYLKEENNTIKLGDTEYDPNISENMAIMDMLPLARKMHAQEIRGKWSLGNVGVQMAGIDKIHLGATRIGDLSEEDLLEYNVRDTIIPEILDNFLGAIEAHMILGWSLQSTLDDMKITAVVNDIAMLRAYHKEGIVLPTRDFAEKQDEVKYKAAEPDARPGIYKGLLVTDLVHAYPFAVISKNVSPETKDPEGNNIVKYISVDGKEREVRFNDERSVFIETLKEIMNDRKKIKKKLKTLKKNTNLWKRYKTIDFALKTQAAAFSHGIFGWANSRMRDYQVADAITSIVRNLIDVVKKACDVVGQPWVYAHTDSCFININKSYNEGMIGYLNDILEDHSEGSKVMPELDIKGYYPHAYIHSPARNVLIPEDSSIDDDSTWDVTGCNFMRSETPTPLANIEINMIKLKMKGASKESMIYQLKKEILNLRDINKSDLGIIKPLTKPIEEYGKTLLDGSHGNIPYHIKALLRAREEYDFDVEVGDKFCIIPIITDETTGVRVIKRKKVFIAFPIEEGLPEEYEVDYENYLKSSLFGKVNGLFDMTSRKLGKEVMTEEIKKKLKGGK